MVHYNIFFLVEGKDKLLNPKLDGLQKHAGKKKPLILHPWLLVGDYYIMIANTKKIKGIVLAEF